MDYSKTLNLPQTEFPMRGDLPKREPEMLKWWEEQQVYSKRVAAGKDKPKFILHDGPPYANGNIHMGHALNKVLKDIVIKYKSLQGFNTPYVPGWDTHGLPIEHAAIKILGLNRHQLHPLELRKKCAEYALKYVSIQREDFIRLGVWAEWDNPYVTLKPEYEAKQIEVFGEMAKKGYIYKGLKSVYWCTSCETALAEAEIEYQEKKSHSIYVKFPLVDDKGLLKGIADLSKTYVVIWTTTPWTLPANVAICLNPDFEYAVVKAGPEIFLMAKELVETVAQEIGLTDWEILQVFPGKDLEWLKARHPFVEREVPLVMGYHVTLEAGTGCVHTAPGHGTEDFEVGVNNNLPVLNPVDHRGRFTQEAGKFAGLKVEEANKPIIEEIEGLGLLLGHGSIKHQYAHCWRCKNPIIYRATEQWFASVDGFREQALAAIENVRWIPNWGRDRIHNMVADRQDWCISRQRVWGVPIPIFYCTSCNESIINDTTIGAVADLFRREGSDAWFVKSAAEILGDGVTCPQCGHKEFRKETDIMDVWFDSGSSHAAVLARRPALSWPADLYLEGSDQHRGWFQSSLLTSVATKGTAPYRAVLTHGFVVDGEGRKMSKSLGNTIAPQDIIKQYGADILRLWVASADYKADIRISKDILKQMSEVYRKIRNTARYILGNLADFDPVKDKAAYEDLREIDKWALLKLQRLVQRVTEAYEEYEYHLLYHAVHNFCAVDMSAIYLDILKDRLYTAPATSRERRAAQTVMYEILSALVRLIAPVLSFTAEEIWRYMPKESGALLSVQMLDWPAVNKLWQDDALEAKWERILAIRTDVSKALEIARREKVIGHSLDARVDIYATGDLYKFIKAMEAELPTISIVSAAAVHQGTAPADAYKSEELDLAVKVSPATGTKCERCWNYSETVGQDAQHPALCRRCAVVVTGL